MASRGVLRTVPDTNVVLAAEISPGPKSPSAEYFDRWKKREFLILYSEDTLLEYIEKLQDKSIPAPSIRLFLSSLFQLGIQVDIDFFHLPSYPADTDDIAFLLCADNGSASHLVTYDRHLRDVAAYYSFKICEPASFLEDLRGLHAS